MYRYIAFTWNPRSEQQSAIVDSIASGPLNDVVQWQCAYSCDGLRVYHSGAEARAWKAYEVQGNGGVVLGTVFPRRDEPKGINSKVAFTEYESRQVIATKGRHLVDHYWGRYIALLRSTDDRRTVRVLRDPTGALQCYWFNHRGVCIVCSGVDVCSRLGLLSPSVNWSHIVGYMQYFRILTKETGLDGVEQVLPGECIELTTERRSATFYWSPDSIHNERTFEERDAAMRELRAEIEYCIDSWASCYDNILHTLSGGLDSSMVLSCLSRTTQSKAITCVNYYTSASIGDERRFARLAAALAKVELIETPIRASAQSLESMFVGTKHATPMQAGFNSEAGMLQEKLVAARKIGAIFSGQGGDHLFQKTKTPLIVSDYVWHRGVRPGLLKVVVDTALLTNKSVWTILRSLLAASVLRRRKDPYALPRDSAVLSQSALKLVDRRSIEHPWIESARRLPPAKRQQVFLIIDSLMSHYEYADYADVVHPLISQPIVELCLQIPTYRLTYSGVDRALVRDAFSARMPPEITTRVNKGATTSEVIDLVVGNLSFLRGFLLEGYLTREGILDRQGTESVLKESGVVKNTELIWPILTAIQAEAWLKTWLDESYSEAA